MNAQGRTVETVPLFFFTLSDLTSSVKKSKWKFCFLKIFRFLYLSSFNGSIFGL